MILNFEVFEMVELQIVTVNRTGQITSILEVPGSLETSLKCISVSLPGQQRLISPNQAEERPQLALENYLEQVISKSTNSKISQNSRQRLFSCNHQSQCFKKHPTLGYLLKGRCVRPQLTIQRPYVVFNHKLSQRMRQSGGKISIFSSPPEAQPDCTPGWFGLFCGKNLQKFHPSSAPYGRQLIGESFSETGLAAAVHLIRVQTSAKFALCSSITCPPSSDSTLNALITEGCLEEQIAVVVFDVLQVCCRVLTSVLVCRVRGRI